jgi:hypothetical protein
VAGELLSALSRRPRWGAAADRSAFAVLVSYLPSVRRGTRRKLPPAALRLGIAWTGGNRCGDAPLAAGADRPGAGQRRARNRGPSHLIDAILAPPAISAWRWARTGPGGGPSAAGYVQSTTRAGVGDLHVAITDQAGAAGTPAAGQVSGSGQRSPTRRSHGGTAAGLRFSGHRRVTMSRASGRRQPRW